MSSPTPRKEKRKKWWSEKLKSRAAVREGLRPNPSVVNPFMITSENKGGFKPSDQTRKVLSASTNPSQPKAASNTEHRNSIKTKDKSQPKAKNSSKNNKIKNESVSKNQTNSKQKTENSDQKKSLETQYVLFIGNLPYSVTKEDLEEHFRKTGGVKKIRIPQDKAKQSSRGFAYIEFKDRISHGIALRLHHTTLGGRKINVEFTSIGGKNDKRKEKLKKKNEALVKFKMPLDS